ncbi:unnamed protein product [Owenia fusiformis]|uniref:Uncharacterized protein n=1 Tax=Owenia fusiformis TaxID=6347 RepID=A0A8J1UER5_OWEFU|nr:unnamed protein product [Owenia fusiformis]
MARFYLKQYWTTFMVLSLWLLWTMLHSAVDKCVANNPSTHLIGEIKLDEIFRKDMKRWDSKKHESVNHSKQIDTELAPTFGQYLTSLKKRKRKPTATKTKKRMSQKGKDFNGDSRTKNKIIQMSGQNHIESLKKHSNHEGYHNEIDLNDKTQKVSKKRIIKFANKYPNNLLEDPIDPKGNEGTYQVDFPMDVDDNVDDKDDDALLGELEIDLDFEGVVALHEFQSYKYMYVPELEEE